MRTNLIETTFRWPTVKRPEPRPYLYPGAPGGIAVPCWACFRTGQYGMSATLDPAIGGGDLVEACGACARTLRSGGTVALPAGDELHDLTLSWARWDTNGEVDSDFTERMLAAFFPALVDTDRASWFESLQGALLELQEQNEFGFELLSLPPEARDVEALEADAVAKVDECIGALMGGANFCTICQSYYAGSVCPCGWSVQDGAQVARDGGAR